MIYEKIAKPLLFQLDPENAHHLTIGGLSLLNKLPAAAGLLENMYGTKYDEALAMNIWGIPFANPLGLAAGLDKNAEAVYAFSAIGFGFVEVGTVTPLAQPGNDKPRLFRLPEDEALINRMGFNNNGAEHMAHNLRAIPERKVPIAINIGKNKSTPNEEAEEDYRKCIRALYPLGDLFVVNISSPNTPDLRNLQYGDSLRALLAAVSDEMERQRLGHGGPEKPILVKIAPDIDDEAIEPMIETMIAANISGVIATNTTISRNNLTHPNANETGGLSGKPVRNRSTEIIRRIYRMTEGRLVIVGCGGIFSADDAYEKILAGASLVEVYTALIYKGPGITREITDGLSRLLARDGFQNMQQAVGACAK